MAVKYGPRSRLPPVRVRWGEIHRGYNKDNWPGFAKSVGLNTGETVSAIKYITPTSFAKPTSAPAVANIQESPVAALLCTG